MKKRARRNGEGRALFAACEAYGCAQGYRLVQAKTVDPGHDPECDATVAHFRGAGSAAGGLPNLWDENWPCLILVKTL